MRDARTRRRDFRRFDAPRASATTRRSTLRVVCLVGPSDSGKTTLVESLVPKLAEHGRVATVKSIHHDVEIDTPGTDTHRHRIAGAETVVGVTPELTFDVSTRGKRDPPDRPAGADRLESDDPELRALASTLARLERRAYEFVIVEGFAAAPLPTILVGDRDPADVGGRIVGRGEDGVDDLVEAIRGLEPGPLEASVTAAAGAGTDAETGSDRETPLTRAGNETNSR